MTSFVEDIQGLVEHVKESATGVKEEGGEEAWLALVEDPELKVRPGRVDRIVAACTDVFVSSHSRPFNRLLAP